MTHLLKRIPAVAAVLVVAAASLVAAACGSSSPHSPTVPGASSSANSAGGGSRAAIAAAVACIRDHGIPAFKDPVVTPDGTIYTDSRSFEDAPRSTQRAVQESCRELMVRAHLDPSEQPPAPAALVQAGVRTARCARAHGLPKAKDPTSLSHYTPGHGFGRDPNEVPGGKNSPGFQQFARACRAEIDAEIKASELASLGGHES